MYNPQMRFDSHQYLIIRNLFIHASSDFHVAREDLLSILEHFDHIKTYRFEEESEHGYWTTVYVKFKNSFYAEQAQKVFDSMRYIDVEFLPNILNRYDELEEKIRVTNQICDRPSCVIIDSAHLNASFKDLLNKFSRYGCILNTSDHTNFVALWYERASEAIAAEIDNNKWKNQAHYFKVKVHEQLKELTLRMINMKIVNNCLINAYETSFEDEADGVCNFPLAEINANFTEDEMNANFPEDEVNANFPEDEKNANFSTTSVDSNLPTAKIHSVDILSPDLAFDFFDKTSPNSENMQSCSSYGVFNATSPELQTCTEPVSSKPEVVSFDPNDYIFYLQIIKKNNEDGTNSKSSPGISIEVPEYGPFIYSSILSNSESSSCPNIGIYDESESETRSESLSSSVYNNFETIKTNLHSMSETFDFDYMSNNSDLKESIPTFPMPLEMNPTDNAKSESMPFYQPATRTKDDGIENSCVERNESSLYNIPNTYSCPCCGSWIITASPWSIVPNIFIVPTTHFGKPRCRFAPPTFSVMKSANKNKLAESFSPADGLVPELDEENFPPLDCKKQLFSKKQISTQNGKVSNDRETTISKKSRASKLNEQNIDSTAINENFSTVKTENLPKCHARKNRDWHLRFLPDRQTTSQSQDNALKFNSIHVNNQNLSSTSSDERNDHRKHCRSHSRRKNNPQKMKDTVYSCSSNSTLNFKPANRRRHRSLKMEGET